MMTPDDKNHKVDIVVDKSKDISFFPPGAVSVRHLPNDGDVERNPNNDDDEFCIGADVYSFEAQVTKAMKKEDEYNESKQYKYDAKKASFFPKDDDFDKSKKKRDWFFVWMGFLTMVFLALMTTGFVTGLFLSIKDNGAGAGHDGDAVSTAERQAYYEHLLVFFGLPFLDPLSPQAQAMEWLAFEDEPLPFPPEDDDENNYNRLRLEQRYGLVTWYFAQGGPKLWSGINSDSSAGWIMHGTDVHECDWHGVDCQATTMVTNATIKSEENGGGTSIEGEENRVVVGIRLSPALGVVLTGTSLSTELGMLSHLRTLDFHSQRLEGTIPNEWRVLTNLESLVLSKNRMTTTIPDWIGDWQQLKTLALDQINLEGSIPSSLLTIPNLRHLELQGNQMLGGSFHEIMLAHPNLEYLDISFTQLEGTIPSEVDMPNIRFFGATSLNLLGSIPNKIGSWTSVEIISMSNNAILQGTLPTEFGLLTALQTLEIEFTGISGSLPSELGMLSNLVNILMESNQLEGTLPVEFSKLTKLEVVSLEENAMLSGTIPPEYSLLTNLKELKLYDTALAGEVAPELCVPGFDIWANCDIENDPDHKVICNCCLCGA